MRKPTLDRIASLNAQRAALNAEIRRLQQVATATARKADTRRKILVGAAVLADPDLLAIVRATLDAKVSRAEDRALLGLPPLPA